MAHSEREHSEVGASAAYRWVLCPGSVGLLEKHPMPTSDAAAYGTKAHELSELQLKDMVVNYDEYDAEMIENVREYVDWIRTLAGSIQKKTGKWPEMIVEQRFALQSITEGTSLEAFGTNDVGLYVPGRRLDIIDLKYGRRFVSVEENMQTMYYTLGMIEELWLEVEEVHLWIYGPRMEMDVAAFHWECPLDRLKEFHAELKAAAQRVESHPEEYNPGEAQCFYCNKAECPAIQGELAETFGAIEPLGAAEMTRSFEAMTTEALVERYNWKELLEGAFRDIAVLLKHRAEQGETVPGHKLVRSEGNRAFRGDVTTEQIVKLGLPKSEVLEEPKRKTPAKIEKAIKSKFPARKAADKAKRQKIMDKFDGMVERPDRGLKLVSDSQPGEAVAPALEFDDVDEYAQFD